MISSEKSFWKFYVVLVQNNGKEMYKKKCAARAKMAFFAVFVVVAAWLALRDFIFCFSKL